MPGADTEIAQNVRAEILNTFQELLEEKGHDIAGFDFYAHFQKYLQSLSLEDLVRIAPKEKYEDILTAGIARLKNLIQQELQQEEAKYPQYFVGMNASITTAAGRKIELKGTVRKISNSEIQIGSKVISILDLSPKDKIRFSPLIRERYFTNYRMTLQAKHKREAYLLKYVVQKCIDSNYCPAFYEEIDYRFDEMGNLNPLASTWWCSYEQMFDTLYSSYRRNLYNRIASYMKDTAQKIGRISSKILEIRELKASLEAECRRRHERLMKIIYATAGAIALLLVLIICRHLKNR